MIARGTNECGIEDSVVAGMMNPKNKPPASLSPDTSLDLEWTASGVLIAYCLCLMLLCYAHDKWRWRLICIAYYILYIV
jgi:hypothetical protein